MKVIALFGWLAFAFMAGWYQLNPRTIYVEVETAHRIAIMGRTSEGDIYRTFAEIPGEGGIVTAEHSGLARFAYCDVRFAVDSH